jgi:hypothetical protein
LRAEAREVVGELLELQRRTGGEPPLPMASAPGYLLEMESQAGNQLVKALAANAERIVADIDTWRARAEESERRLATWKTVERLAAHARGLDGFAGIAPSIDAVRDNRQLLDEPDPVPAIRAVLGDALRQALQAKIEAFTARLDAGIAVLKASDEWLRLSEHQQEGILARQSLRRPREVSLSSDRDLLAALDAESLAQWDNRIAAMESHLDTARNDIAHMLEPQVVPVALERKLLRKPADVDHWLEQTREALLRHINEGHPVQIK